MRSIFEKIFKKSCYLTGLKTSIHTKARLEAAIALEVNDTAFKFSIHEVIAFTSPLDLTQDPFLLPLSPQVYTVILSTG